MRMVEAALGILSNVAFYTPRRTRTAPRLDKAGTLFTQVAPDDASSALQRADCPGAEGGAASVGVAATDPAVASALAMLPAARRCAVAALVTNGEATPEDVCATAAALGAAAMSSHSCARASNPVQCDA